MNFLDMKKAVGRRSSDPNATRYSDAIEDYILDAMSNLLLSEDMLAEQAQPLINEVVRNVRLHSGIGYIRINNINFPYILKFIEPVIDIESTRKITFIEDSLNRFNYRRDNPILQPDENECFWTKDGKYIRFYFSVDRLAEIPVIFRIIENPLKSTLESAEDLLTAGYGQQFLYRVIDLASANLRKQIGME